MCELIVINIGFKFNKNWIEKDSFGERIIGLLWENFVFRSKCESNERGSLEW